MENISTYLDDGKKTTLQTLQEHIATLNQAEKSAVNSAQTDSDTTQDDGERRSYQSMLMTTFSAHSVGMANKQNTQGSLLQSVLSAAGTSAAQSTADRVAFGKQAAANMVQTLEKDAFENTYADLLSQIKEELEEAVENKEITTDEAASIVEELEARAEAALQAKLATAKVDADSTAKSDTSSEPVQQDAAPVQNFGDAAPVQNSGDAAPLSTESGGSSSSEATDSQAEESQSLNVYV